MEKTYVCARWPTYSIRHLYFQDGRYTTNSPDDQAVIEHCEMFGIEIHLQGGAAPAPPAPLMPARTAAGSAHQGTRGTGRNRSLQSEESANAPESRPTGHEG